MNNFIESLQLWRHLAVIEDSTGLSSNRASIVKKIRPFLLFMVANVVCGLAAAVLQANRAIVMCSQFTAPTQDSAYFTADHYAFFDVFAPVRVIIYAVSIYFAWKPRPPSVSTGAAFIRGAPSSRPSPRPVDAAAGLDDRAVCDHDAPLHVPFELMESDGAARSMDGSMPPSVELETTNQLFSSSKIAVISASEDTSVLLVGHSSDAD
jgi:hypothetical protein